MFLSYCWSNSRAAVKLGTREQEGALGATDPRDIKTILEENGLSCWLDIHESGKVCISFHGLVVKFTQQPSS